MFPVDARDMYMVTPLLFCIRSGQAALAKHLLNKGANILASDKITNISIRREDVCSLIQQMLSQCRLSASNAEEDRKSVV